MKIMVFNLEFSHSDATKRSTKVNDPLKYLFIVLALSKISSSVKKSIARDLYGYWKSINMMSLHNLFNVYK